MRRIAVFVAITVCMFQMMFPVSASAKTVATFKEAQGREGPGAYYKLIVIIPAKTTLELKETKKSWHKVVFKEQTIWVSANAVGEPQQGGRDASLSNDIFKSLDTGNVSAEASPATITAAIKGFWTRYSRNRDETYELPVEGYEIAPDTYLSFAESRMSRVDRDRLWQEYELPDIDNDRDIPYKNEHSIGYACASAAATAPLYTNREVIEYVSSVGWYIAESTGRDDIPFTYYIIDTDHVNAIACPGGYIVLTRGLIELMGDEAELAALLAHEMAHVIAGHGMYEVMDNKIRNNASTAFEALSETVGRTEIEEQLLAVTDRARAIAEAPKLDEYEYEADRLAMCYLARSGYDVSAQIRLLTTMKALHDRSVDMFDLNYRNHPDFGERLKRVKREMERYGDHKGQAFRNMFDRKMLPLR